MDYLPLPRGIETPFFEVPYLEDQEREYDGLDFFSYPERRGYKHRTIFEWADKIFKNPPAYFQAFLQTWLFWGYLDTVLGRRIPVRDFIRPGKLGSRIIMIAELIKGIDATDIRSRSLKMVGPIYYNLMEPERRPKAKDPLEDNLGAHKISLHTYLTTNKSASLIPKCPLDSRIMFSIGALMEWSLTSEANCPIGDSSNISFEEIPRQVPIKKFKRYSQNPAAICDEPFLVSKFIDRGWCPYDVQSIYQRLNMSGRYFMAHLDRLDPWRRHVTATTFGPFPPNETQESMIKKRLICSGRQCSQVQVLERDYRRAHDDGCDGNRPDTAVDMNDMDKILSDGSFPVVSILDDTVSNGTIKLSKCDPSIPYVAISHVWSDGLGNNRENAIPTCQVRRLSYLIRDLCQFAEDRRVQHFWLDTLCVPPDSANRPALQEMAIMRMRDTYSQAWAVLVIERTISSVNLKDKTDIELMMRITCSPWNRRLWTLQEGALARQLFFQFKDGVCHFESTLDCVQNATGPLSENSLRASIELRAAEILCHRFTTLSHGEKLLYLATALFHRATSVSSDEPLCLATLLRLDIEKIMAARVDQRMLNFWSQMTEVPAEVLLWNTPTLSVDGYRWAPTSLISVAAFSLSSHSVQSPRYIAATRCPRGLKATFLGMHFPLKDRSLSIIEDIMLYNKERKEYFRVQPFTPSMKACNETVSESGLAIRSNYTEHQSRGWFIFAHLP
ncbi:hypothetical protein BU16DRAFT_614420 [Lophium mytilinum]|uniref:Heterokaryon incompatibility domain-containing protein n=1 Tax=Lophium mytilinum TaxID=390894 RepID=A0A6A6R7W9_9PEZI|nr:hypothetical protein BU16DRAFT_614420 [Lophium mytilinum]